MSQRVIPESVKTELAKVLLDVFKQAEALESSAPTTYDGQGYTTEQAEQIVKSEVICNEGYDNGSVDDEISKEPINIPMPQRYASACASYNATQAEYKKYREQFATADEKKSATDTDINVQFGTVEAVDNTFLNEFEKAMKGFGSFCSPRTSSAKSAERKAAQRQTKSSSVPLYSEDTVDFAGKAYKFTRVKKDVSWDEKLSVVNNTHDAYKKLQSLVTHDILNQFGSWERIREIIVFDNQLIINGVCYTPTLSNIIHRYLPLDTFNYLSHGMLAPLFNWGRLRLMSGLQYLRIDNPAFYADFMRSCLNWHKDITALFVICPMLSVIQIGEDTLARDSDVKTLAKYKESEIKRGYFDGVMNGYKLNICKNTGDFQNYTFSCLKDYVKSKGDKNIFMFMGGVAARAGLALGASALNLTTNVGGGLLRGGLRLGASAFGKLKNVFKQGVTPVGEDDFN